MKHGWKLVKLGEVLMPSENWVAVNPVENYPQVGIRLWGEGVYARESVLGNQTQYKSFCKAEKGDLTFNKIWVRNGAVAVIPESLDGFFVSPEFPVYHPQKEIVSPDWLNLFTKWKPFWESCSEKAFGTSGKNRVKPSTFLQIEIPLPPLAEQQRIAGRLAALKGKVDAVRGLRGEQEREMKNLLLGQYRKIVDGAVWKPMREVAPLERRKVDLQPNTVYREIGVRSFGKGIFEKPSFNSDDLTWEKPNWIKTGDLLMSNIKAWEGAVASIGKEHDDKVGSHRYLTFVPNPEITSAEFLAFHFLTEDGLLKLSEASPGSADRNRTLNTKIILNTRVPVPDIHLQNDFLQLQTKMEQLKTAQAGQMKDLEGLFPAVLERAFRGEW